LKIAHIPEDRHTVEHFQHCSLTPLLCTSSGAHNMVVVEVSRRNV